MGLKTHLSIAQNVKMEKDEAIKILAKELVKLGYIEKMDYFQFSLVKDKENYGFVPFSTEYTYGPYGTLEEKLAKRYGANYIISLKKICNDSYFIPVAYIGKNEARILNETYYKNIPKNLEIAMKELGIKCYSTLYRIYMNGFPFWDGDLLKNLGFDIFQIVKTNFDEGSCYVMRIYPKKGDHKFTFKHSQIEEYIEDNKRGIHFEKKDKDFCTFVFKLPKKEQNVEVNRIWISTNSIPLDEVFHYLYYNKPEDFKFYWNEIRDSKVKKDLVSYIDTFKNRNLELDCFLLKIGFDVKTEWLDLYKSKNKEAAKFFIVYFIKASIEERKHILKVLINERDKNEEIDKYLSENHSQLIKEVIREEYNEI